MLETVAYMTQKERQDTAQYIKDLDAACKVDADATFEAMEKGADFNMVIHFNMMKCETLIDMKKPIYPLTADDYVRICSPETEEERRSELCNVLAEKELNLKKENKGMKNESKYSETRIGAVLNKKDDSADEPVMDCVAEKDAEVGGIAKDRLRSLIERIERLQEEKKGIGEDISAVFAEAKAAGFDIKTMRTVLKLRKMNAADIDAQECLVDLYRKALDF